MLTSPIVHFVVLTSLELAVVARILLRPHRAPASRVAWVAVVALLPILGMLAYLLVGEVRVGHRRVRRLRAVQGALPPLVDAPRAESPVRYAPVFHTAASISGFEPVAGNSGRLSGDSSETIAGIVADIDTAEEHVHLLFYIWLDDRNGTRVAEALARAAGRGVACRALADGLGSRRMIASEPWRAMRAAGVRAEVAMPLRNASIRPWGERLDLRNHRKIVVVDDRITWCGSQNCADPEFRVKPRFAPWVDAMIRFEGPVARQNQRLFVSDWMTDVDEDLRELLRRPPPRAEGGFPAQVVGTGPTVRPSATPELFAALMFAARRELVVTTPYYVPDESIHGALCSAAFRGVATKLVVPARNDSPLVSAASRSYYAELLAAGVELHEYVGGLLHTKSLTVDGELALIGSANLDRRSFDLNHENNVLFHDATLAGELRALQERYLASSRAVRAEEVAAWPLHRRLWNNALATLSPVL